MIDLELFDITSVFIFLILFCSLSTILARNPVNSTLFLALVFLNTALFFIILGAEFLGLLLIIVYVGAILILFLFVIRMLNLKIIYHDIFYIKSPAISLLICLIIFITFFVFYYAPQTIYVDFVDFTPDYSDVKYALYKNSDITNIGTIIYNYMYPLILVVGVVLLAILVAIIVLTNNSYTVNRNLHIKEQILKVTELYPLSYFFYEDPKKN